VFASTLEKNISENKNKKSEAGKFQLQTFTNSPGRI
jgi:hypothetical protein